MSLKDKINHYKHEEYMSELEFVSTLLDEPEVPTILEDDFLKYFWGTFSKEGITRDNPVVTAWVDRVAGTLTTRVNIVNYQGEFVAQVPAIADHSIVSTGDVALSEVHNRFNMEKKNLPNLAERNLGLGRDHYLKTMSVDQSPWGELYALYGDNNSPDTNASDESFELDSLLDE